MAEWRFVDDEEDAALRSSPPAYRVGEPPPLEWWNIYEVVGGSVTPYPTSPENSDTISVTPGWYIRVLEEELPGHTYNGAGLRVKMFDLEIELKPDILVTIFPPEHLEKACELASAGSD